MRSSHAFCSFPFLFSRDSCKVNLHRTVLFLLRHGMYFPIDVYILEILTKVSFSIMLTSYRTLGDLSQLVLLAAIKPTYFIIFSQQLNINSFISQLNLSWVIFDCSIVSNLFETIAVLDIDGNLRHLDTDHNWWAHATFTGITAFRFGKWT